MAMVVLLFEGVDPGVALGPGAASRLARLGVTSVSLLRDRRIVAAVLEGWAFDASGASGAAAILNGRATATLLPFIQVAVSLPSGPEPSEEPAS